MDRSNTGMAARAVLIVCSMLIAGCAAHWPEKASIQATQTEFNIAPKQLLASVKKVISSPPMSIGVDKEEKGSIITGYQSFPGDWHIARRWQERTRYRITIIPDFDEPTSRSRLEVVEQTEQRAAEGMKWDTAGELDRPERARDLVKRISEAVNNTPAAGK